MSDIEEKVRKMYEHVAKDSNLFMGDWIENARAAEENNERIDAEAESYRQENEESARASEEVEQADY